MRGGRNGAARAGSAVRATVSAMVMLAACKGGGKSIAEGPWDFKVDTVRSGTAPEARTAWLRSVGKEGPEGEPPARDVILSFDCRADHVGATILTEQALRQGSVEIELAVDAEPTRRLDGFAGTTPTGGQVALTLPQDSVLALLSGHQRATIHYADGAGSSRTAAVFPVAGVERLRAPFLAACSAERGATR